MTKSPRYTLTEHEKLPGYVKATTLTPAQEKIVSKHQGVVYTDYASADKAADEINDWACERADGLPSLAPSRPAHLTGFSSRYRIDGDRLYVPVRAPQQ